MFEASVVLFLSLVAAHALCDYPLQGDFLAKAKNRSAPVAGVPWWQALGAHAAIHGGAVGAVTGVWWLGLFEAVSHFIIDDLKCRGVMGFNSDQFSHILCKIAWVAVVVFVT